MTPAPATVNCFVPTRLSENTFSTRVGNGHSTRALYVLASADTHYRRHIPRSLSPVHRLIVIVVLLVLFGAQRPPDASRPRSRSLMMYRPEHPTTSAARGAPAAEGISDSGSASGGGRRHPWGAITNPQG